MIYGDWIGRWGRSHPDKEALVDWIQGRRYSYAELAREINKMARYLAGELQIRQGDRVACLAFNRTEYLLLFFALSRIGAILVPLNVRLSRDEFHYYLEDARPRTLFFDRDHLETVGYLKDRGWIAETVCFDPEDCLGPALPSVWDALSPEPPDEVEIAGHDPQLIIYTSGTTGPPKGVILTHGMITWNSLNTNLGWDLRSADRTILHPALFYTAGWNVFTLPLFQARGTNILIRGFDAELVLELIETEAVSLFFGVPTMFQMLLEAEGFERTTFQSVRFMVSGGAPLSREIFERFKAEKQVHLWEGYGLTEIGPNNFQANGPLGTVGHPMPHVDCKLIDREGRHVPSGESGELLLRGPHLCAGYWNKPEATAKAIRDGWFHTGDQARIDQDGNLAIVGRLKDMIISGGININPAEIEAAASEHPQVRAAAVIGVPDAKWGETVKVIVELGEGENLDCGELARFLEPRLARYKIPKYLAVVKELPRTAASGKIQKFKLKQDYGEARHG
jgi:fatty-acyl-CoA synthase